jgi:hypothetical protein
MIDHLVINVIDVSVLFDNLNVITHRQVRLYEYELFIVLLMNHSFNYSWGRWKWAIHLKLNMKIKSIQSSLCHFTNTLFKTKLLREEKIFDFQYLTLEEFRLILQKYYNEIQIKLMTSLKYFLFFIDKYISSLQF